MDIYEQLNIRTIINASDTYTVIGGSRISRDTLAYMQYASQFFVDIQDLSEKICEKIAEKTGNEAAFISSGSAACMVLTAAACMVLDDKELAYKLPDTTECKKNEIIVFASQVNCAILPYWHLVELSGATLIQVEDSLEAFTNAITENTACAFFFAGTVYEWTTPNLEKIIEIAKNKNIRFIVDAAAQLPPKSNTHYYTKQLGADAVIFSGGKFINGPQSTGIVLGKADLIQYYKELANPNVKIGRPFKVGKEEYLGIYKAFIDFMDSDETKTFGKLESILYRIGSALIDNPQYKKIYEKQGRLGQAIPMLYLQFTTDTVAVDCYQYMRAEPNRIDFGNFNCKDPSKKENCLFVNAINLREEDVPKIIEKFNAFIVKQ